MVSNPPPNEETLSLAAKERIDRICLSFEDAWKAGKPPALESFVTEMDEPERSALLRELLLLDLYYRRARGETPSQDEYAQQFPGHSALIREAFDELGAKRVGAASQAPAATTPETIPTQGDTVTYPAGETIGRYTVQKLLGRGGFGTVYLAWDEQLRRRVAIKIPRRDRFRSTEEEDQFFEEARTAAQLKHPSIVPVHDVGRHRDGVPFVVMDYVEGRPLDQLLKQDRLSYARLVEIVIEVAEAIQYAHRQGIVHRDLKPANVLIDTEGRALITDFGLAERWEQHGPVPRPGTSPVAGTLHFIAPEVFAGTGPAGPAADIYALGVTVYRAMVGRHPFEGANLGDLQQKALEGRPPLPKVIRADVPEPLQRICLKALEAHPEDRYESAQAMIEDLRRYLDGREVLARPTRYDAELSGRLRNHYTEIRAWHEQGLITLAEMDRLMRPYWFLMQEERPGRPLPRLLPWEALLIRLGGWFVLLASLLWPSFYWENLGSPWQKVLSVGLPTLGLNLVGWLFHRGGGKANARVFLAIGALLVPLLAAVVLCENGCLIDDQGKALELILGQQQAPPAFITPSNLQLTIAAACFLAYSLLLVWICRSRVFALWVGIGIYTLFAGILLRCGLRQWVTNQQVAWALVYALAVCVLFWPGSLAWATGAGKRRAAWLFIFFPVPFVLLMTALGWYGSEEWFHDTKPQLDHNQTKNIWWMLNALVYWAAALLTLRSKAGYIRFWGAFFLFLVPLSLLVPANLIFGEGPKSIWKLGAEPVTVYELLLCLFAVGLVIVGMKWSLATIAVPGLVGLGEAVFRITDRHFRDYLSWPLGACLGGAAAMLVAGLSWLVRYSSISRPLPQAKESAWSVLE